MNVSMNVSMNAPNKHCECPGAGFCKRHKIYKTDAQYLMCSGQATNKPDCGFRFWCAWENGRLGATAPKDPQTTNDWDCNSTVEDKNPGKAATVKRSKSRASKRPPRRKPSGTKPVYVSTIGDKLAAKFESIGIKPTRGCSCQRVQKQLNQVSADEVLNNLNHWAAIVQKSAKQWKTLKGGMWNLMPIPSVSFLAGMLRTIAESEK